jgi:hypothetical protein
MPKYSTMRSIKQAKEVGRGHIFFGTLGMIGLGLMMWAKLMNPEQVNLTEWDEEE